MNFFKKRLSEDYGDSPHKHEIKRRITSARSKWSRNGWMIGGDLNLSDLGITRLPKMYITLGDVDVSKNPLGSLEGSPKRARSFDCSNCGLTSLLGGPYNISERFNASSNLLGSLKGGPKAGGDFDLSFNSLRSLEGSPTMVWSIKLNNNYLRTLEGGPLFCFGDYDCSHNELRALNIASVAGKLIATNNPLTDISGVACQIPLLDVSYGVQGFEDAPIGVKRLICRL